MARRKGGRKSKGGRGKAVINSPFKPVFGGGRKSGRGRKR